MHIQRVGVAIYVEYSISKYLLNQFKSTGYEQMEERAEQIHLMGDVLRIELHNGVRRRRETYTKHEINELSSLLPTKETTGPTVGTEMVFQERTSDL